MMEKRRLSLRDSHLDCMAQAAAVEPVDVSALRPRTGQITDLVSQLVTKGRDHLERKQYADALDYFESALYLDADHQGALMGRNRVYRKLIPRWHFEMLNDESRNAAFERALAKAITPDTVVLDIGSGSGLLAMMAARAGARETISCEMVPPIAELARFTVERNGYADRVIVLDKKSVDMSVPADMPRRANLMVTETVDCGLLGEGIIPTVTHARQNLLTADAHIVPCSASVIAMLVESRALFGLNRAHIAAGFDVSPINSYATAGYFPVRLGAFEYKPLTEPFVAFTFDFMADAHTASVRNIDVPVLRSGICHAVVFWFDMQLDEELSLSNRPGSDTHWEQALQCLDGENEVEAGAVLNLEAQHDCTMVSFKLEAR